MTLDRGEFATYKDAKTISGETLYLEIRRFKDEMREGDVFWLYTDNGLPLGFDSASDLPDFLRFTVHKKYPHCVELHHVEHTWKWDYTHKYTPGYAKLYFQIGRAKLMEKLMKDTIQKVSRGAEIPEASRNI